MYGLHDYSFNLSKNTLLKRFYTLENQKILDFNVNILDDPFEFLLSLKDSEKQLSFYPNDISDFIILPLYSTRTGQVEEHSGLNQWNARGRTRDPNEVYISVPSFIHRYKPNFFSYNTNDNKTAPFEVSLPNGTTMSMRIAQQGGKALMSNPNNALGKWILRDILELPPLEKVTKKQLDIIGIDSIKLSKNIKGEYFLDFLKSGSFSQFEKNINKVWRNNESCRFFCWCWWY